MTTCTLCKATFPPPRIPIINEDAKEAAARLLAQLVQHMTTAHQAELAKFQQAASGYITTLVLGCFDLANEDLRRNAEEGRAFAVRVLTAPTQSTPSNSASSSTTPGTP